MNQFRAVAAGLALLVSASTVAEAGELLRGSRRSMQRQHGVAVDNGYRFVETPRDAKELLAAGELVEVRGNADYDVSPARYRYALPEVRTFLERLGRQYREATGEPLVVTSLARPTTRQPANAHALSVHPAGMAIDLRVPRDAASRRWLEDALIGLERRGLVDVTRERRPPHYHVAIYPEAYREYAEERMAAEAVERTRTAATVMAATAAVAGAAATERSAVPGARRAGGRRAGGRLPAWFGAAVLLAGLVASAASKRLRGRGAQGDTALARG
ncbi:MAG TPA: DUF5715 family protein [Longimicrobiales bacterium]